MDAPRNGLSLKREERRVLRSPLRTMPMAPRAGSAHAHGEEAYNDRVGRARALPFGLVTVGLLLWWAAEEGGYAPTTWYSGSAPLPRAPGRRRRRFEDRRGRPTPWAWAAIALLTAFTASSFLLIAWAGVQGDAWDGANRTLFYAVVYATLRSPLLAHSRGGPGARALRGGYGQRSAASRSPRRASRPSTEIGLLRRPVTRTRARRSS